MKHIKTGEVSSFAGFRVLKVNPQYAKGGKVFKAPKGWRKTKQDEGEKTYKHKDGREIIVSDSMVGTPSFKIIWEIEKSYNWEDWKRKKFPMTKEGTKEMEEFLTKLMSSSYAKGGAIDLDAISKNPPYAVAIDMYGEGDPDDIFVGFYKDNSRYGGGRSYYGRGADKNNRWSMRDVFNDGYEPKIFQTIEDYRAWKKSGSKMAKVGSTYAKGGEVDGRYLISLDGRNDLWRGNDYDEAYDEFINQRSKYLYKMDVILIDTLNDETLDYYDAQEDREQDDDFAKGGEVKKKGNEEHNTMLIGGIAGILLGIFLGRK